MFKKMRLKRIIKKQKENRKKILDENYVLNKHEAASEKVVENYWKKVDAYREKHGKEPRFNFLAKIKRDFYLFVYPNIFFRPYLTQKRIEMYNDLNIEGSDIKYLCENYAKSYRDYNGYDPIKVRDFDLGKVDRMYRDYFWQLKKDPQNFINNNGFANYPGPFSEKYMSFFEEMGFDLEEIFPDNEAEFKKEAFEVAAKAEADKFKFFYQDLKIFKKISSFLFLPVIFGLVVALISTFFF